MSFPENVTPVILTSNEELNLDRCLAALHWAKRVVIVDSGSSDRTLDIASTYEQVEICQRSFDHFAPQLNFGLEKVRTEWVLTLDADYICTKDLGEELSTLQSPDSTSGYEARFTYCVFGRPLRGSLYPPRIVLFKKDNASFVRDGHRQRLELTGSIQRLRSPILHDDRKPFDRWLAAQKSYLASEVEKLSTTPSPKLTLPDRVRKLRVVAPLLVFPYVLLAKGTILDGWPGWYYAFQRTYAELLLSLVLLDRDLRSRSSEASVS